MSLFTTPPQSICILRLSAIGDVCNALAVVQAIQRAYPQCKITWVIGKTERQLFAEISDINFVVYDKKAGWRGIWQLWKSLRYQHFDVLLNMQTALRASILSLGIKAKCKLGFDDYRSREGQKFFVNKQVVPASNHHVLAGFMQFAQAIGVDIKQPTWDLHITAEAVKEVRQLFDPSQPTLLIAPCSSKAEKDWLPENYAQIVNLAHSQGKQVILCGTTAHREISMASKIEELCHFKPINLLGKTSLVKLCALIGEVDLVLTPDSGAGHLANAMDTEVIGLYAYHNPKRTAPYNYQGNVISVYETALAQEPKLPQPLPWAYKLKTPNLMAKISVEMVAKKMREIGFLT